MIRTLDFCFPAEHISQNDRLHWRRKAELTRLWRSAACWNGLAAKWNDIGPATVQFEFFGVVVRDPGNLAPTVKAIVDGLVDAGFWPDDSSEWVTELPTTVIRKRARIQDRTVTITITPKEPS